MELKVEVLVTHLQKIRTTQGEADYQQALQGLIRQVLIDPGTEPFVHSLLEKLGTSLDLEPLKAEAEKIRVQRQKATEIAKQVLDGGKNLQQVMTDAIRNQIPNLKTQAHFDLTMAAFDALQHYLNACFGGGQDAVKYLEALHKSLELASQISVLEAQAQELPEELQKKHPAFFEPAKELTEQDKVNALLAEVPKLESSEHLQQWYQEKKPLLDSIVTQQLRNILFDAIRERRNELSN